MYVFDIIAFGWLLPKYCDEVLSNCCFEHWIDFSQGENASESLSHILAAIIAVLLSDRNNE